MVIRTTIIVVVLLSGIVRPSLANSMSVHRFSEFEQQIWRIVQAEPPADPLAALKSLHAADLSWPDKALLLMQQCRLAVRQSKQKQPALISELTAISTHNSTQNSMAALSKCLQYHAILESASEQILALENTAYYALTPTDGPLMHMWLAFDFANAAMDAGMTDEALAAITLSIQIAQQNSLTEWLSESLGILALLQSDLGKHQQAQQTISDAIARAQNPANQETLQLRKAYVLKQAKEYQQSLAIYQSLLNTAGERLELFTTAALNIAAIYHATGQQRENRQLTAELLSRVDKTQDPYSWAQAATVRAFALLSDGQYEPANQLFDEAKRWFEQHGWLIYLLPSLEEWAELLAKQQRFEQAYLTAQHAKQLRDKLNEQRRLQNAMLKNAQLEILQQHQALLESKQSEQQLTIKLEQKKREQQLIITVSAAIVILTTVVLLAYRRLQHANQKLALKNIELDYESTHDPLTKVFNRRYFNHFIEKKLASNCQALFLLIDIDHFKKVNDTWGHHAGDQVLQEVSNRLASRLRDSDCIVRWGGEEFLIFIEEPTDVINAKALVLRLLSEVSSQPIQLEQTILNVTISVGFSLRRLADAASFNAMLIEIDEYLYQAKNQGRNQAVGNFPMTQATPLTLKTAE